MNISESVMLSVDVRWKRSRLRRSRLVAPFGQVSSKRYHPSKGISVSGITSMRCSAAETLVLVVLFSSTTVPVAG